jgi:hypothetical protein
VGELGGVFARGLLRLGLTVTPVRRGDDVASIAHGLPRPEIVCLTVGEADLERAVCAVPTPWRGALVLVQNELREADLARWKLSECTVCAAWFEKKPGTDVRPLLPSRVAGPVAPLSAAALAALGIPVEVHPVSARAQILAEKNLYILVTNLAGLWLGGDTGTLIREHRALLDALADDVLALEARLAIPAGADTDGAIDADAARERLLAACLADPGHACRGRVAPERLRRTLAHGDRLGLALPAIRALAADLGVAPGSPSSEPVSGMAPQPSSGVPAADGERG